MTKIWHDDVRRAPEGWLWCRTNDQAKDAFLIHNIEEISMDHDLGLDYIDVDIYESRPEEIWILAGTGDETGLHLAEWMVENDCVPPIVRVHSWNPDGAMRIARILADHAQVSVRPFNPKVDYDNV